jgi:hypothetical protein
LLLCKVRGGDCYSEQKCLEDCHRKCQYGFSGVVGSSN